MNSLRNRHLFLLDAVLLSLTPLFVYALRFEGLTWGLEHTRAVLIFTAATVPARLLVYYLFGIYRRLWNYASIAELELIVVAAVAGSLVSAALGGWVLPALGWMSEPIPISPLFANSMLSIAILATPRLLIRMDGWHSVRRSLLGNEPRVLIAGAGSAGQAVLRELQSNPALRLVPVGFVDDDPTKQGMQVGHLPIFGKLAETGDVIRRHRIKQVIVAMPSTSGLVIRQVVRDALDAGVNTRTVPSLSELLTGHARVGALRDVQIEDLLRREPIETDMRRVAQMAHDKVVLVTGAGGSIGGELSRQIAALGPAKLLLLGHGENPIFDILNELRRRHPSLIITPVIADIRDRGRITDLFERHRPYAVFHAAAHKHVPLMEENVVEAITNNVLGTKNVIEAALAMNVEHFVFISTDKAVRPTNVMGATKRVAEHLVLQAAVANARNFVSVRFGNVLGSRGSVVPTFVQQIREGGPVTVTHPEMRRYFMTIPEAVQLVLQAGALGKGGELFMLDMGEPVRVVDLARDLIRLSGLLEGEDIEIQFTGIRPGEKLYEEMFFSDELAERTSHPKVLRARQPMIESWGEHLIDQLLQSARKGGSEEDLRHMLHAIVPEFSASIPVEAILAAAVRAEELASIKVSGARPRASGPRGRTPAP